jgi:hypothetical protein
MIAELLSVIRHGCINIYSLQRATFTPHFKEKRRDWQISATGSWFRIGCKPEKILKTDAVCGAKTF